MKKRAVKERTWVKQVLEKYDAIEKRQPKSFNMAGADWPDWVWKLCVTFFPVSHPGLKVKNAKKWTAKDLGHYLGRQNALEKLLWNEIPLSERVEQESERLFDFYAKKIELNPKASARALRDAERLEKWRPIFKKFIDDTLIEAHARPYPESSAFLEAFGKANVIKPDDLASEKTIGVGERIAYVMFSFWGLIDKFETVAELHRFLSAVAKPSGIVITLKRVEKLCTRIGLKLKKGPGRPKKKIQTNTPLLA